MYKGVDLKLGILPQYKAVHSCLNAPTNPTLVNVYVDLVVFTRIAGSS